MNGIEHLDVISEFSIGMAGFAGIVAVFVGTNRGWTSVLKYRAGNLIVLSLCPGFASLISLGLSPYYSDSQIWQYSCGVLLLLSVLYFLYGSRLSVAAYKHPLISMQNPVNTILWILFGLMMVVQLIGATGYAQEKTFGIFYGGLIFYLSVAALNFYRLVFPPNDDPEGA